MDNRHRGSSSGRRPHAAHRSRGMSYATVGSHAQPRQPTTGARPPGEQRPAASPPVVKLNAGHSGSSTPASENRVQSSTPDRPSPTTPHNINNSQGRDDAGEDRDTRPTTNRQEPENEAQEDTRPWRESVNHRRNSDSPDRHRRDEDDGPSAADIIEDLKYQNRRRTGIIRKLKDREAEQEKVIEKMKSQLARAQTDRDQVDELMKDRTAELHSAQTFLGKADGISIAEVSKSVEFLNAEIHQASAIIMDSVSSTKLNKDDKGDIARLNSALNALGSFTGESIKRMLYNKMTNEKEEFDPTVSQIVLQSGLVSACAQIIKQWASNPQCWDDFTNLDSIYSAMRTSEGQAIAGRWRALAHAYISSQNEDSVQLKETTEYLMRILGCLLAGVGWSERVLNVPLPSEYAEKIDIIAKKAIEVHNILRKEVTSLDLEAYIVPFDQKFDPKNMEDEYKDGDKDSDSGVCTIALGLRSKKIIVPKNHGVFKEETVTILKPKVVLVSALVGEAAT